jgi:hypothetical protein
MQCSNNHKQLGLALHNYHDTYKIFPPQDILKSASRAWGWSALILPFMEQTALHQQLNPDGQVLPPPTTLYGGLPLLQQKLPAFRCPSDAGPPTNPFFRFPNNATGGMYATSNYPANQSVIIWDGYTQATRIGDIIDGTTNTFLLSERRLQEGATGKRHTGALVFGRQGGSDSSVVFHACWPINTPSVTTSDFNQSSGDPGCTRHNVSSLHPGGAQFANCDGSVRFVSQTIATNPACPRAGGPCVAGVDEDDPAYPAGPITRGTGPGFVYQNLYDHNDGRVIGEF